MSDTGRRNQAEVLVLRSIFASKRDELTGDERKLHKKELRDLHFCISALLHFSPDIIWVIKSRIM